MNNREIKGTLFIVIVFIIAGLLCYLIDVCKRISVPRPEGKYVVTSLRQQNTVIAYCDTLIVRGNIYYLYDKDGNVKMQIIGGQEAIKIEKNTGEI